VAKVMSRRRLGGPKNVGLLQDRFRNEDANTAFCAKFSADTSSWMCDAFNSITVNIDCGAVKSISSEEIRLAYLSSVSVPVKPPRFIDIAYWHASVLPRLNMFHVIDTNCINTR